MEGIIRELDSFNRRKGRRRILYGAIAGFVGGLALAGGFLWGQESRIAKLEEEKTEIEKELEKKVTEEESTKKILEQALERQESFDWEDPKIWGRLVGGFFITLEADPFGDRVFPTDRNISHAANQLYDAMGEFYICWKEKNRQGFVRAFEMTYFDAIKNVDGEKTDILFRPLAPNWYEILADPLNTDYDNHRKAISFIFKMYCGSGKRIKCNEIANDFKVYTQNLTAQLPAGTSQQKKDTFKRRVLAWFGDYYDFLGENKGECILAPEDASKAELPPGYK